MLVYVLDGWERKDTRPWKRWYPGRLECKWQPDDAHKIKPKHSDFATPAVAIIHWTYLLEVCGHDYAEACLEAVSACEAGLYMVVVSGGNLPDGGNRERIYWRRTKVGTASDDPFQSYLCEFVAALVSTGTPDFQLLEPEPRPLALIEARSAVGLTGHFPAELSVEAKRQCLRIIARGDGRAPMRGSDIDWLKRADWPDTFLADEATCVKFVNVVGLLLSRLAARAESGLGSE